MVALPTGAHSDANNANNVSTGLVALEPEDVGSKDGQYRTRTCDILLVRQALYQLS